VSKPRSDTPPAEAQQKARLDTIMAKLVSLPSPAGPVAGANGAAPV
jgi:hypothetical protein